MEKKCRFCPRVCHKQEHLDRHERTHTKVRPYQCEACEKHFVRSDTLKRHQKLHVAESSKVGSKRVSKVKRNRADRTSSDATQSDLSTESSVDQSPVQEVVEPQFSYDTLEAWEFPSFDSGFTTNLFSFTGEDHVGNQFEESYSPFDNGSIESNGDFTINPENLWGL